MSISQDLLSPSSSTSPCSILTSTSIKLRSPSDYGRIHHIIDQRIVGKMKEGKGLTAVIWTIWIHMVGRSGESKTSVSFVDHLSFSESDTRAMKEVITASIHRAEFIPYRNHSINLYFKVRLVSCHLLFSRNRSLIFDVYFLWCCILQGYPS
jgi:hypothetical protein